MSAHYQNIQRQVISLKQSLGGICVDCGCSDLRVLEFDHVDKKRKLYHVFNAPSFEARRREALKCTLRCRRCHRIKSFRVKHPSPLPHLSPGGVIRGAASSPSSKKYLHLKRKEKQAFVNRVKKSVFGETCELCGWNAQGNFCALDFDHLHAFDKRQSISKMINSCFSNNNITREIEKCQLLCANCHHISTLEQRQSTLYRQVARSGYTT